VHRGWRDNMTDDELLDEMQPLVDAMREYTERTPL
jgi:hypothetical protein